MRKMSRGKVFFAQLGQFPLSPRHRKIRPTIFGWGPYFCPADYAQPRINTGNFGRSVKNLHGAWGTLSHSEADKLVCLFRACTAKNSLPCDMVILGNRLFGEIMGMPVCLENAGFVALS